MKRNLSIKEITLVGSLLAIGALMLAFTGCGGGSSLTLNQANFDKIHDDMSPAEVRSILGSPSQSSTQPIPIVGGTQTTYVYENDKSSATIIFKNDLVKEKHSSFINDSGTSTSTTTTPTPTNP